MMQPNGDEVLKPASRRVARMALRRSTPNFRSLAESCEGSNSGGGPLRSIWRGETVALAGYRDVSDYDRLTTPSGASPARGQGVVLGAVPRRTAIAPRPLHAFQIRQNRAVRAMIAAAGAHEPMQRRCYALHFRDPRFEVGEVRGGDLFHLPARATLVAPKSQQRRYFRHREAELARVADEAQLVHIVLVISAITVPFAGGGLQKTDRLVMADHFRADARSRRSHADIHDRESLDFTTIGSCSDDGLGFQGRSAQTRWME